jgi:hypothetical protein
LKLDLDRIAPHAIDIASLNCDTARYEETLELAHSRNMHLIAGSDSHTTEHVGLFYIETEKDVTTDAELAIELKAGRYSLSGNSTLLEERKVEVSEQESTADEVLQKGGGPAEFLSAGGTHMCFFNRRKAGGSYCPGPFMADVARPGKIRN